jgi:hypothetical protein
MVPTWQRPNWQAPSGRRTRQHYVAFFSTEAPDFEVQADEDGLPDGDPLAGFELEAYDAAAWIAGWWAGPLERFLTVPEVREARAAMGAWAGPLDGKTLAGLQGGMALCRAWARSGAIAVLDVVALRWWRAEELLALKPDRPFDVTEHVAITLEDGFCHTRGLAKFARPDVGARGADKAPVVQALAAAMAQGLDPRDGETMRLAHTVWKLTAQPDDSGQPAPRFFNSWLELEAGPRALLG